MWEMGEVMSIMLVVVLPFLIWRVVPPPVRAWAVASLLGGLLIGIGGLIWGFEETLDDTAGLEANYVGPYTLVPVAAVLIGWPLVAMIVRAASFLWRHIFGGTGMRREKG